MFGTPIHIGDLVAIKIKTHRYGGTKFPSGRVTGFKGKSVEVFFEEAIEHHYVAKTTILWPASKCFVRQDNSKLILDNEALAERVIRLLGALEAKELEKKEIQARYDILSDSYNRMKELVKEQKEL